MTFLGYDSPAGRGIIREYIEVNNYKMKYYPIFILFLIVLITSCSTVPKEGEYNNYSYDKIIKKHGAPETDAVYNVNNDYVRYGELEPYFPHFFTEEELNAGMEVRRLVWEKFNNRLIIWLRKIDDQWVVFDSLEYNSLYVNF